MTKINSPYWNERVGVCKKHHLPQIRCPHCPAEHDPNAKVQLTEFNKAALDFNPDLSVQNLLPTEGSN